MSTGEQQTSLVDVDVLRAELKEWEAEFRAANGRKPGRADIKKDATIAAKYKQYDRIAKRTTSQLTLPPPAATPKKSTRHVELPEALRERSQNTVLATPKKTPSEPTDGMVQIPVQSPVPETPAFIRNALGPTPQKDGHVLGIFDVVSGETPAGEEKVVAQAIDTVIAATPSKETYISSEAHFSKTPQSVGKRYFLDSFAGTPLKRKREDDVGSTSASKRKFATPSFLRRSFPLASICEDSAEHRSGPALFSKRGLSRSLSSIIQGLKQQENDAADEEWNILNEIEEEEQGVKPKTTKHPTTLVEDSQLVEMPLGPDQAPESDEETLGGEDPGNRRKPWKKKGLKRQTRRVIMRPVLHKATKADDEGSSEKEDEVVPETQPQDLVGSDGNGQDESDDSNFDDDDKHQESLVKSKAKKCELREVKVIKIKPKEMKHDEKAAKKPRKVNPDAHANFRKLKIKNKNSKANGRGRKFGRR